MSFGDNTTFEGVNARVAVYVDGFNLYFGLKEARYSRYYWLNIELLAQSFLLEDQKLMFVKYFTADIQGNSEKWRRQRTFLEALDIYCSKLTTIKGFYQKKVQDCPNNKWKNCHKCDGKIRLSEEKKTDVNIAVHMVTDAFEDKYDTAILVSGDSDISPPIEVVLSRFPKKQVVVAFPPKRRSDELRKVANNKTFWINEQHLRKSQLPDPVIKPNGYELRKPDSWK